jgi:ribosomal protein L13E
VATLQSHVLLEPVVVLAVSCSGCHGGYCHEAAGRGFSLIVLTAAGLLSLLVGLADAPLRGEGAAG